jgi:hypothetical protein
METPFPPAAFQVVLGGALVLAAGIVIGGLDVRRAASVVRDR